MKVNFLEDFLDKFLAKVDGSGDSSGVIYVTYDDAKTYLNSGGFNILDVIEEIGTQFTNQAFLDTGYNFSGLVSCSNVNSVKYNTLLNDGTLDGIALELKLKILSSNTDLNSNGNLLSPLDTMMNPLQRGDAEALLNSGNADCVDANCVGHGQGVLRDLQGNTPDEIIDMTNSAVDDAATDFATDFAGDPMDSHGY